MLKVTVPEDVPNRRSILVIKGDVVPQPYVGTRSPPRSSRNLFRMLVQHPVTLTMETASLNLTAAQAGKVRGKTVRNRAFKASVTVTISRLRRPVIQTSR